jgi:hypothetical protein
MGLISGRGKNIPFATTGFSPALLVAVSSA